MLLNGICVLLLPQAMVARGDLGAELPIEEVPILQVSSCFSFQINQKTDKLFLAFKNYGVGITGKDH